MLRSRLAKKQEQDGKKNLILSILGIGLIAIIAFKFGIPLLINFSLFLSGLNSKYESTALRNQFFIAPPVLDSSPEATSSADIVITGYALKGQTINLYINDNFIDATQTGENGRFEFRNTIKPGENTIKTIVSENGKESDFSNILTVVFRNAPPSLKIDSPFDHQIFRDQNSVGVNGSSDPDVKVTVNGHWAITNDNGDYSYNLILQSGENKITVVAEDVAGNKTEKEVSVTYSP